MSDLPDDLRVEITPESTEEDRFKNQVLEVIYDDDRPFVSTTQIHSQVDAQTKDTTRKHLGELRDMGRVGHQSTSGADNASENWWIKFSDSEKPRNLEAPTRDPSVGVDSWQDLTLVDLFLVKYPSQTMDFGLVLSATATVFLAIGIAVEVVDSMPLFEPTQVILVVGMMMLVTGVPGIIFAVAGFVGSMVTAVRQGDTPLPREGDGSNTE